MATIIPITKSVAAKIWCSSCGISADAACDCGAPYIPAGQAAAKALAANPEKSDRAIAAELGVNRSTVTRAREARGANAPPEVRIGMDGKSYPAPEPKSTLVRGTFGTGENEWYTPNQHIELARQVLGHIDLDPASSAQANEVVRADRFFTEKQNGLEQDWFGRVWLNPPYAQPFIADFARKLLVELEIGRVESAIALTHNYTDTSWFHWLAEMASCICFTRGRVKFVSPQGELAAPTQGQAFFYFGPSTDRFADVFDETGFVVKPC